ncbi:hypothetical protein PtA15_10A624 [Puccinia triticina]|uniref:Uncharacterized protein n=1 Tax=Puccinia triticina TaxID=208348 RepID=A0ABY7CW57_9BASI|nr:uncharacterized protein PtA15_10A624 [Puccinia triticina]WAQ89200.1 hypothetical protein PtA15_10A624 [Puccinia triticina]
MTAGLLHKERRQRSTFKLRQDLHNKGDKRPNHHIRQRIGPTTSAHEKTPRCAATCSAQQLLQILVPLNKTRPPVISKQWRLAVDRTCDTDSINNTIEDSRLRQIANARSKWINSLVGTAIFVKPYSIRLTTLESSRSPAP